jgi:hypothetical protein
MEQKLDEQYLSIRRRTPNNTIRLRRFAPGLAGACRKFSCASTNTATKPGETIASLRLVRNVLQIIVRVHGDLRLVLNPARHASDDAGSVWFVDEFPMTAITTLASQ